MKKQKANIGEIIFLLFLFSSLILLLHTCFEDCEPNIIYYQCLEECNINHRIVGAGRESERCYQKCDKIPKMVCKEGDDYKFRY